MKYDLSSLRRINNDKLKDANVPDPTGALTMENEINNPQDASKISQKLYSGSNAIKQIYQNRKRAENTEQLLSKTMARSIGNNTEIKPEVEKE